MNFTVQKWTVNPEATDHLMRCNFVRYKHLTAEKIPSQRMSCFTTPYNKHSPKTGYPFIIIYVATGFANRRDNLVHDPVCKSFCIWLMALEYQLIHAAFGEEIFACIVQFPDMQIVHIRIFYLNYLFFIKISDTTIYISNI